MTAARLGIVQYGGSFERLAADLDNDSLANYFGQQDMLGNIARTGWRYGHCRLVSVKSPRPYDVDIDERSGVVGLGLDPHRDTAAVVDAIDALGFTHVLLQTPIPALITGIAAIPRVRLAAALADSFNETSIRARRYRRQLVDALNTPAVELVANHGPNAARHLVDLGVTGKTVLPYDFDYPFSPADAPVKASATEFGRRILYVGSVIDGKGVPDLLEALPAVLDGAPDVRLTVVGDGEDRAAMVDAVAANGLGDVVEFTGSLPHAETLERQRNAAVSVVPSRHSYGEGLPLTIYEAWATRTPLVTSDHPMFRHRAIDGYTALVVPERQPQAIAAALTQLLADDDLYRRLSENAEIGWQLLQGSVRFWPMVWDWLDGDLGGRG